MTVEDLKKAVKEKKIVFGKNNVLKKLRLGEVKTVFLASNCPRDLKDMVNKYAKLTQTKIIELDVPNEEIGVICKKPFSISILGY